MKIQILLEKLYDTDQTEQQYGGRFRVSRERKASKELGRGGHAAVSSTLDPHMVKKHSVKPYGKTGAAAKDGFNKFIEYLINYEVDNPHFPRVYNVKKITDSLGNHIHTYQMEKLVEFYDPSITPELLNGFLESNFTERARADYGLTREVTKQDDVDYRLDYVASMLQEWVMENGTAGLHQDSLKAAVTILFRMYRNNIGSIDIHGDNLMWRRTGTGLTLVFNDPFY